MAFSLSSNSFILKALIRFSLIADPTGSYLLVLKTTTAPDNANPSSTDNCALALGTNVTTCGDVTVFKIESSTGHRTSHW